MNKLSVFTLHFNAYIGDNIRIKCGGEANGILSSILTRLNLGCCFADFYMKFENFELILVGFTLLGTCK